MTRELAWTEKRATGENVFLKLGGI
jgi:hypothetical protein